jgi:hypothetical protein
LLVVSRLRKLQHRSAAKALEYVGYPAHVIDMRVRDEEVPGGVGPAVLS